MYAKINGGTVVKFPYTFGDLRKDNPNVSFPRNIPQGVMQRYGMVAVTDGTKPDGTTMYIVGSAGDDVNEYSLSSAWDISTASYVRVITVAGQETVPTALFFKPDGTKMYITGTTGDDVNEYNLSTAWNISTASYSQVFDSGVQEGTPSGLSFKPDGTRMYVIGSGKDGISEFALGTPWDVGTASYLDSFSLGGETTSPEALFFKPDGTQFFIVTNFDAVASYTIAPQT